jgi:manganese transport protein
VPALGGVVPLGDHGVGQMLVVSQIVLALQLPFAIWPLVQLSGNAKLMGGLPAGKSARTTGWVLFAAILLANIWLLLSLIGLR